MTRPTATVLAHVLTERNMQREKYDPEHDAALTDDEWNALIARYLYRGDLAGDGTRYSALVQVAALAVAAAEQLEPQP